MSNWLAVILILLFVAILIVTIVLLTLQRDTRDAIRSQSMRVGERLVFEQDPFTITIGGPGTYDNNLVASSIAPGKYRLETEIVVTSPGSVIVNNDRDIGSQVGTYRVSRVFTLTSNQDVSSERFELDATAAITLYHRIYEIY